jgi:hypothetical protein
MGQYVPAVSTVRWMTMGSVTSWLTSNIIDVQQYLATKKPACAPDTDWWIFLFAVNSLAKRSAKVFESLQGTTTLLSQQKESLANLAKDYCELTGMQGPLSDAEIDAASLTASELCGRFLYSHYKALIYLRNLDLWVLDNLPALDENVVRDLGQVPDLKEKKWRRG